MMMVITGPVSDVQCLVFSPVSIEVSESRDQSRQSVSPPSPVGKPLLSIVTAGLVVVVVHLGEGGEHEARDDGGEGSDGQGREAQRGHG